MQPARVGERATRAGGHLLELKVGRNEYFNPAGQPPPRPRLCACVVAMRGTSLAFARVPVSVNDEQLTVKATIISDLSATFFS